jgi:hypothetical protein
MSATIVDHSVIPRSAATRTVKRRFSLPTHCRIYKLQPYSALNYSSWSKNVQTCHLLACSMTYTSVCPSVTWSQRAKLLYFSYEIRYWIFFTQDLSRICVLRTNRPSDNHTLFMGVPEYLPVISIFDDRFG